MAGLPPDAYLSSLQAFPTTAQRPKRIPREQKSREANSNVKSNLCSRFSQRNLRVTIVTGASFPTFVTPCGARRSEPLETKGACRREGSYALVCLDRGGACRGRARRRRRGGAGRAYS